MFLGTRSEDTRTSIPKVTSINHEGHEVHTKSLTKNPRATFVSFVVKIFGLLRCDYRYPKIKSINHEGHEGARREFN